MYVLDDEKYNRLKQAMSDIVLQSHVPQKFIETSAVGSIDKADMDYLLSFSDLRKEGKLGGYLKFGGIQNIKFNYMAGALIRNFIDARVLTIEQALDLGDSNPTVLFLTDFCIASEDSKPLPSWKTQQIYDLILHRFDGKRQTILSATSQGSILKNYGIHLKDFLIENYKTNC